MSKRKKIFLASTLVLLGLLVAVLFLIDRQTDNSYKGEVAGINIESPKIEQIEQFETTHQDAATDDLTSSSIDSAPQPVIFSPPSPVFSSPSFQLIPEQASTDESPPQAVSAPVSSSPPNPLPVWGGVSSGSNPEVPAAPLVLDSTPPNPPTVSTPIANSTVTDGSQTISGTKTSDSVLVWVNSESTGVTYPSSTTWEKTVDLAFGINTFSITSTDGAGNQSEAVSYSISLDNQGPDVPVVISPANNFTFYSENDYDQDTPGMQVLLLGTKTADASLVLINSAGVIYPSSTSWQKTITLSTGINSFSLLAKDEFGNESPSVSHTVSYDDSPLPDAPTVTSHSNNATVYPENDLEADAGMQILFSGTKPPSAATVQINGSSSGVLYPTDTTWQKTITLSSGANSFTLKSVTSANRESSSTSHTVNYNSTPLPEIDLIFSSHRPTSLTIPVSWSSTTPGVASFDVEYKTGNGSFVSWKSATTAISDNFYATQDRTTYTFRARSRSTRIGDWEEQSTEIFLQAVIINEIAWPGTDASSNDEWIELYNNTNSAISLAGWKLTTLSGSINTTLSGTISAKGYYLLERTDDTTIDSLAADKIYTGYLDNGGDRINLINDENRTIDVVDMSSTGWTAGTVAGKKTAERINPNLSSFASNNFATSTATSSETDSEDNPIKGTPKAVNSVLNASLAAATPIVYDTAINRDTVFDELGEIYKTQGAGLTLSADTTLVVRPGVAILANSQIQINGKLSVVGTGSSNAVFTSYRDSNYGGAGGANPGDWTGIKFNAGASSLSSIDYAKIIYAGSAGGMSGGIIVNGSNPTITNSIIERSIYGATVLSGNPTISNNTMQNNDATGLRIAGGSAVINNNSSLANQYGAIIEGGGPTLTSNVFDNNTSEAIQWYFLSSTLAGSGNTASGNPKNAIELAGGSNTGGNHTFVNLGLGYSVNSLTVRASDTLTINPGTIIKFSSGMTVNGKLIAVGTAGNRIVFTSSTDPGVPVPGQWGNVNLTASSSVETQIAYADFKNGTGLSGTTGALYVAVNGLSFDYLNFDGNGLGLFVNSSNISISQSMFNNNPSGGLINNTSNLVNAENNYWGNASGPRHSSNPGGTGDNVSDNIDFDPFLTEAP
ncbi:MAG: lamin tail domain-containing protein [Candidatus Doudnabacteria bacterium]|nr:lamin tail domain-containing protein [Candidatus Doudnabacteria bacterium]